MTSLRTQLEFRSGAFPALLGESEQINPRRWGKRLADYLRAALSAQGFIVGEPYAEDWGWVVPIENAEFPLWVGCGNIDEEDDGFVCFIEPSKPYVRKLFRKIDVRERVAAVAVALEDSLLNNPQVREFKWEDSNAT